MPASPPRVLVTRAPQQASALADRLRELGVEPVLIPTIETVDPISFAPLDQALTQLPTFHWLLFTSANAVEAFACRLKQQSIFTLSSRAGAEGRSGEPPAFRESSTAGPRPCPEGEGTFRPLSLPARKDGVLAPEITTHSRIAAIGPSTARALQQLGLPPNLVPPQAVAESLTEALLPHAHQPDGTPTRFLLVRAEEAREHLPESLRAAGAKVTVAPAYRTVIPEGTTDRIKRLLAIKPIDAVTFTSSSTARNLFTLLEAAHCTLPQSVVRASIGPITSATLQELGYPAHVEAPQATVDSLTKTLMSYLNAHPH